MQLSSQDLSRYLQYLLAKNEEAVGPDALLATASMFYHAAPLKNVGQQALATYDDPNAIARIISGDFKPPRSFDMGRLAFMLSMMSSGNCVTALQSIGLANSLPVQTYRIHDTQRVESPEHQGLVPKAPWYVLATSIGDYNEKVTLIVTCGTKFAANITRWTLRSRGYTYIQIYEHEVPYFELPPRPTTFTPCSASNNAAVQLVDIIERSKEQGFAVDFNLIDTTVSAIPRYKAFATSVDNAGQMRLLGMSSLLATALGASDKVAEYASFNANQLDPDALMALINKSVFRKWYTPTYTMF